jgi:hypothetical protein
MIIHMRTTLIIPDEIMRELKRRAAERGDTLSDVVAECLKRGLEAPESTGDLPPLPVHSMGAPAVDVTDREALFSAMEEA